MIRFFFFCLSMLFLINCKNSKNQDTAISETVKSDSIALVSKLIKSELKALEKQVGKLPSEAGLFTNFGLAERIEKVMGKDYQDFKETWVKETPIKKDGEILYTSGCQIDVCKANRYILIIDMLQNGINIYNFKHDKGRSYEEDNTIIGMPFKLQDDFEKIRIEQGL